MKFNACFESENLTCQFFPCCRPRPGYNAEYTGAWALLGAGIGAGLSAIGAGIGIGRIGGQRRKAWRVSRKAGTIQIRAR